MTSRFTRRQIWRHNGLFGHTAMARQAMRAVQESQTATRDAKLLASSIERDLIRLAQLLKERDE